MDRLYYRSGSGSLHNSSTALGVATPGRPELGGVGATKKLRGNVGKSKVVRCSGHVIMQVKRM